MAKRLTVLAVLLASLSTQAGTLTVSVLYFDNNTGKPEYEPFKKGLADMLVTDLVQLPGLTVVEREKFQAVVAEQQLSRSHFFDPATAVKLGKMLGATHVVTGAITALEPKVRLEVRLVEVATGKITVSGQVVGDGGDLFDLEQQLVRRFAGGLAVKEKGLVTGRATLAALLAYSRGLDAIDSGQFESARSTMTQALQASPGFELARKRYAEVLARLDAATKTHEALLSDDERVLEQHITEWTASPLKGATRERARLIAGYHFARYMLGVARLKRLVGEGVRGGLPAVLPAADQAAASRLEAAALATAARLATELSTAEVGGNVGLLPEDDERLRRVTGITSIINWPRQSGEAAEFAARLALLGTDRDQKLSYRPTLAQRDPTVIGAHLAGFDLAASQSRVKDTAEWYACDEGAQGLVLAGQREAAVARWQHFLDTHPGSPHFVEGRKRIEELLMVTPELVSAGDDLKACKEEVMNRINSLFVAVSRSEGRPGVERLVATMEKCAPKHPTWRPVSYMMAADQDVWRGDCEHFRKMRALNDKLGSLYAVNFTRFGSLCAR